MNPVKHVAIIMDGNGRWGIKHKGLRNSGHRAGLNTIEAIIDETINQDIKYLTLFTFSTENWKRPKNEIIFLFKLLSRLCVNYLVMILIELINKNAIFIGSQYKAQRNWFQPWSEERRVISQESRHGVLI